MSVNAAILSSNPVWTPGTTAWAVPALGAPGVSLVPALLASGGTPRAIIISNTGPINLWVGDSATAAILLQPGGAISIALGSGGGPYIHDTVGTGTFGVVAFE